jgi:hypothetical protein
VVYVRFNGRDDHSSFIGEQIDAGERDEGPRINDDAFVKNVVKHVNDTRAAGRTFKRHPTALSVLRFMGR